MVEDEQVLADAIAVGLRRESMAVDVAYDGDSALERANVNDYDVIILDRDLPGTHGDEVCKSLATARYPGRILMLTAAGELDDKVAGLSLGADDWPSPSLSPNSSPGCAPSPGFRAAPPVLRASAWTCHRWSEDGRPSRH